MTNKKNNSKKTKKIKLIVNTLFISINEQYGVARMGRQLLPRVYLTPFAKAYKEAVSWEAKQAYKGKPTKKPIKIQIWYYFPDGKKRDILNDKLTTDAFQGIIYENDSQIKEAHVYKRHDSKNPRTKIIITIL